MKKVSMLVCTIILFGFANNASPTSPMPEEVKPGQTATVCTVHIIGITDHERGMLEEQTSKFAFEVSETKRDVLEWLTKYVNNKLNEKNVSEFKVECKFAK